MSLKERVAQELDNLDEPELRQVADYLSFLKFQARTSHRPQVSENDLAALYAEFADEDRRLAEEGMADYARGLAAEDRR